MHLVVAGTANSSMASFAFTNLTAMLDGYVTWLDPFATVTSWTINPVPCRVLLKLPVPRFLETLVKELVHVLERDVIGSATPWWHMRRISNRHCKNAPQTLMAHTMRTGKFCGSGDGDIVRTAC